MIDNLFFTLSKLAWGLLSPSNLIIIVLMISTILLFLKRTVLASRILVCLSLISFLLMGYPVGEILIEPLEKQFSQPQDMPVKIDGIILLGGSEKLKPTLSWGSPELGSAADRYIAAAKLATLYPEIPVLFSGGNNFLRLQGQGNEGHIAYQILSIVGVNTKRLVIESKARNTHENFILLKPLLPKQDGHYLLVTSAFHMPRAVAVARKQGINIVPYPVDYRSSSPEFRQWDFNLFEHLEVLEPAWREWIGLTVYYLTGKTDEWFAKKE